jgi:hypothetical protein
MPTAYDNERLFRRHVRPSRGQRHYTAPGRDWQGGMR